MTSPWRHGALHGAAETQLRAVETHQGALKLTPDSGGSFDATEITMEAWKLTLEP
jgi:hypothetical protein